MTTYFIGQPDANNEILYVITQMEPLQAPSRLTNFSNAGGTTALLPAATLLPTVAPSFRPLLSGTVDIAPSLLNGLRLANISITGSVLAVAAMPGGFALVTSIQGAVYAVPLIDGSLPTQVIPIPTADLIGEEDDFRRPILPWQVVLKDVDSFLSLSEDGGSTYKVGLLEPFLVSDQFANDEDDLLTRAGGLAGYVGILIDTDTGPALRFRPPYSGEIVVLLSDQSVWRWNVETASWEAHSTLPQRALAAQEHAQMLDAEGIYDFYAKILGLSLAELQYDSKRIQDLVDPVACPDRFLSLLLRNFGADDLDFEETPESKRELLRTFIGLMQQKGTPAAIVNGLRALGYSGYGTHVWVKPQGSVFDVIEKPFGYDLNAPSDPVNDYYPTSQINVHLSQLDGDSVLVIDGTIQQRVARFLRQTSLPAHVSIKWFVSDRPVGTDTVTASDTLTITPI